MSQHVSNDSSQSPSTVPSSTFSASSSTPLAPSSTDLNILASMSQDIAQVFIKYGISAFYTGSKAKAKAKDKKSSEKEHIEHLGQSEQLDESSEKEQSVTFSYNTEEKRTPEYHKIHIDTLEQYGQGEFHEEIRCFRLSKSNVLEEYELLEKHGCVHLAEFLYQTHDELSMMLNLLCSVDNDIILPAKVLQQAFYKMELLLENLEELHRYMENYEQVYKELINAAVIPA